MCISLARCCSGTQCLNPKTLKLTHPDLPRGRASVGRRATVALAWQAAEVTRLLRSEAPPFAPAHMRALFNAPPSLYHGIAPPLAPMFAPQCGTSYFPARFIHADMQLVPSKCCILEVSRAHPFKYLCNEQRCPAQSAHFSTWSAGI